MIKIRLKISYVHLNMVQHRTYIIKNSSNNLDNIDSFSVIMRTLGILDVFRMTIPNYFESRVDSYNHRCDGKIYILD